MTKQELMDEIVANSKKKKVVYLFSFFFFISIEIIINNLIASLSQIFFIVFNIQLERQQTQEKAFELTQKLDADFKDIMPLLAEQVSFTDLC